MVKNIAQGLTVKNKFYLFMVDTCSLIKKFYICRDKYTKTNEKIFYQIVQEIRIKNLYFL